jgi:hypothetical protein
MDHGLETFGIAGFDGDGGVGSASGAGGGGDREADEGPAGKCAHVTVSLKLLLSYMDYGRTGARLT